MWLAGGLAGVGTRGGQAIGATDELGFAAVDEPCHVSDLHATILHLMVPRPQAPDVFLQGARGTYHGHTRERRDDGDLVMSDLVG
ncbi:MAG: DUF1501 domain-containing protein [Planctomycetia bacterium]|nr:DUF1501 domain-containing protein [Planctomycetia bacterium]